MSERRAFPHLVLAALMVAAATTTAVGAVGAAGVADAAVPRWSIQPTPNVPVQNNTLDRVSCASPTDCMAVGLALDQNGNSHTLAQRWNGTAWSVVLTPSPPGSSLTGVSCTSPSACTAVGFTGNDRTLAERWDGASWTIEPTPNPNSIIDDLTAVFCTGPSSCTAVGWFISPAHGDDLALAMHWDGTRWAVQPTPNPATAQTSILQAVSCTSATACTAVGWTWPGKAGTAPTLVERWNGTAWSIQPTNVPPRQFNFNFLTGVSCAATTDCMAVGYSDDGNNGPSIPLAEHWSGTAWTVLPTPSPAGSVASKLQDVQCVSASSCTAVGRSQSGQGASPPLVEQWEGTAWTIQPAPNPLGFTGSALFGVSCPTAGTCNAVGDSSDSIHGTSTLAERLTGNRWSVQSTPNATSLAPGDLSGVACATSTSCAAVGAVFDALPLAEHWDGAAWSIKFPPVPRFQGGQLAAVSCTATTACTAVGYSFDGNDVVRALVDRWDGSIWSIQPTPRLPNTGDSRLRSVSCTSDTACTAVGVRVDFSTGATHAVAERWDGVRWVIQSVSEPAGSRMAELDGVSCASATACTAVGTANGSAGTVTLAERWNGSTWAIQPTPTPAGSKLSILSAVACASTTTCTAVGHSSHGGDVVTLAERWNGTTWSIQPTPDPAGATSSILTGVACAATTACTAVGSSTGGGDATVTLAERLSGTAWSIQATSNPAGAQTSVLSAVSCSAAVTCTAVGSSHFPGANDLTLAERFS